MTTNLLSPDALLSKYCNHGYEPQSKLRGIIPSAARDCSTYQSRSATHTESEFHNKYKLMAAIFIVLTIFLASNISFATDKLPRYQVVAGNDEKAYLVDTTTGFTWVLTYRTIATGREPVAIPYKFIKISPVNQKDFIVENVQGVSLLPNGTP